MTDLSYHPFCRSQRSQSRLCWPVDRTIPPSVLGVQHVHVRCWDETAALFDVPMSALGESRPKWQVLIFPSLRSEGEAQRLKPYSSERRTTKPGVRLASSVIASRLSASSKVCGM